MPPSGRYGPGERKEGRKEGRKKIGTKTSIKGKQRKGGKEETYICFI